jgi:hypothetical protein
MRRVRDAGGDGDANGDEDQAAEVFVSLAVDDAL